MSAHLADLLRDAPLSEHVDLSGRGLTDLTPLLSDLSRFPNLSSLDLSGNDLSTLPADMSCVPLLASLDLTGNASIGARGGPAANGCLEGLLSLPSLRDLRWSPSPGADGEADVVLALPRLVSVNGTSTGARHGNANNNNNTTTTTTTHTATTTATTSSSSSSSSHLEVPLESTVTQEDLDAVSRCYNVVRGLKEASSADAGGGERAAGADPSVLAARFDAHYKEVMADFHAVTQGEEDPFVRHGQVMRAKHRLYDLCFSDAIDTTTAIYPELGHVLQTVRQIHADLVGEVPRLLRGMTSVYVSDLADLQQAVRRSDRETTSLLEAAELLEQETHVHVQEKKEMQAEFERERSILMEELQHLQLENDRLTARLGGEGGGGGGAGGDRSSRLVGSSPHRTPVKKPVAGGGASPLRSGNVSRGGGGGGNRGNITSTSSTSSSSSQVRVLTLRQTLDMISDIYAAKVKFDAKCDAAHLPLETTEQFLYTFLNQRYGLKSLIVEHASAIVAAVKRYAEESNDVAVFGAILRNECDEEFRHVQAQLVATVEELLRVYLSGKYPHKTNAEIASLVKARRTGGALHPEEYTDIVKYLYNEEDAVTLITRVKDHLRRKQLEGDGANNNNVFRIRAPRQLDGGGKKAGSDKIAYAEFVKILLDFQFQGHQRFLARFNAIFRQVDTARSGVLSEQQFRQLLATVSHGKSEREIVSLLNDVDPFNNQQITYSQCVRGLSGVLVEMVTEER